MMRAALLICIVLVCVAISLASPLDLGFGGVYNSPEANLYWARRFPGLFGGASAGGMGGLRALQESINAGARARITP